MKKLLLSLLAFILCISLTITNDNPDRGSYIVNITLLNGESTLIKDAIASRESFPIINDNSHDLNSSAIIQSFNTDHHDITVVDQYINFLQSSRKLGYWNILTFESNKHVRNHKGNQKAGNMLPDPQDMGYGNYSTRGFFKGYYHSLFQSKTCRELMFEVALNTVESLCEDYPVDFYDSIINELDELIELTEISNYYNQTYSYNEYRDSYWRGFIRRRVETDNVPISEIHTYLLQAKNRLLKIDESLLPRYLYEINFNNEIKIFISSIGYTLVNISKKKHIFIDQIQKVKYIEDQTKSYYLIEGIGSYGEGYRYLFDEELNRIN